ncbi:FTR1 family iron permease [Amphibiibacter pelophylacis]|uniref:FTR1 family protein n=1 Tax=Amphibiibacter pelophylacis TaxID=1799477 RepID=A0ACC6NYS1_9BURK
MADGALSKILRRGVATLALAFGVTLAALAPGHSQAAETAAVPVSHLFITLSDAMDTVQAGHSSDTVRLLLQMQDDISRLNAPDSAQKQQVVQRLKEAMANPDAMHMAGLSTALRGFEQALNPVDFSAQRAEFRRRITPAYAQLAQSIAEHSDAPTLLAAYQRFNSTWLASERVVRSSSISHYGAVEVAMALMRVALETQPLDMDKVRAQSVQLKAVLDSYNSGEKLAAAATPAADAAMDLPAATGLLRQGLNAFRAGQIATGQASLTHFISVWPTLEGQVSTRNPALYDRIESELPVILAHGASTAQQLQLESLISALDQINPQAQYTALDAMLILLREGLEALLVVMALLAALKAAGQTTGQGWIIGGVVAGVAASVVGAIALQQLFPDTAGSQRERLEGLVGVVTVALMLAVGAWLHSKSSLKSWNQYIRKHMSKALTTGSLASLFGLSFLSVFREGAETILFYTGILPQMALGDFLLGIAMALALLAVIGFVLLRGSIKIPMSTMFRILTWTIYALGFKILGVSLHTLQISGLIQTSPLLGSWLQNPALGLYPTLETLGAQGLYIVVIVLIQMGVSRSLAPARPAPASLRP